MLSYVVSKSSVKCVKCSLIVPFFFPVFVSYIIITTFMLPNRASIHVCTKTKIYILVWIARDNEDKTTCVRLEH